MGQDEIKYVLWEKAKENKRGERKEHDIVVVVLCSTTFSQGHFFQVSDACVNVQRPVPIDN